MAAALVTANPAAAQTADDFTWLTYPEIRSGWVELGTADVAAGRSPRLSLWIDDEDGFVDILAARTSNGGYAVDGCVGKWIGRWSGCSLSLLDPSRERGYRQVGLCLDYRRHWSAPTKTWCVTLAWYAGSQPSAPGVSVEPGPQAGQITVQLADPVDTGGVPFTYWTQVWDEDGDLVSYNPLAVVGVVDDWRDPQRVVISDLPAGRRVFAYAYAYNGAHTGPSSPQAFVTVPGLPGPPDPVTARRRVGGPVELSWALPASDGGAPVQHYEVYRLDGADRRLVTRTPHLTATDDPGLPGLKEYRYVVAAVTRHGRGPDSQPVVAPLVSGL